VVPKEAYFHMEISRTLSKCRQVNFWFNLKQLVHLYKDRKTLKCEGGNPS